MYFTFEVISLSKLIHHWSDQLTFSLSILYAVRSIKFRSFFTWARGKNVSVQQRARVSSSDVFLPMTGEYLGLHSNIIRVGSWKHEGETSMDLPFLWRLRRRETDQTGTRLSWEPRRITIGVDRLVAGNDSSFVVRSPRHEHVYSSTDYRRNRGEAYGYSIRSKDRRFLFFSTCVATETGLSSCWNCQFGRLRKILPPRT